MPRRTTPLLPGLFLVACATLRSQSLPAGPSSLAQIKDVNIPYLRSPPRIEEFLGGRFRSDMLRVDDFRQRAPGDGIPVSRPTSAWLGYDEKNFYAVFVCRSPPGQTRARMDKREDVLSDDVVGLFLDTYHDHQRSYEFFVNPLGVQADAITNEGQNDDFSFDTLWYSDGRLTPDGFVATISIPFKSLRFSVRDMPTWGLGLGRFIPTNNESSFWPYITQKVNGFSPQLGNLTGLDSISPGRNLQFIPFATFGHDHYLDNPGTTGYSPQFQTSTDLHVGLDAKVIVHDSLALDIALKPDFSQVESDDPLPTVNQRYAVQFSEKRPFFIENNGFFQTPENLFFSRTIISPDYGARLTGKIGRWNLGLLVIDDRSSGLLLGPGDPNYKQDYGRDALVGVARIQREFGKLSSVGVLLTDREFGGGYNRVAGIDTRLALDKNWTFSGQAMASRTEDPFGVTSGGDAFNFSLKGQARNYFYNLGYIDRAEGFQTQVGFVTRANIRQVQQFVNHRWHPKSKVVLSYGPQIQLLGDLDHSNVQQDWQVRPGFQVEMARSTYIGINHGELFERFDNINFRRTDSGFGGHSEYFKRATLDWGYSWGTRIDYNTPTGLNAFLGRGNELQTTLTFRPTSRIKWDEIYSLTRLRTDAGSFAGMAAPPVTGSTGVFVNHLLRSRINFQYNRRLSLRVIIDYNAVLQNPALISLTRQKAVTGDALLTWLMNPGTAVYVGYTDRLENLGLAPGNPNAVFQTSFPSTTTERQFFGKVSYLLRF